VTTLLKKSDNLEKKHILVIDDDDIFRNALSQTLIREGFQVTQAAHGKLAIEIIEIQRIDLIISDINMPGISGLELLHYVKKNKPELPFLLMTGFSELKETQEAYDLGARGFLAKPFQKADLLSVLQEWLDPKNASMGEENQDLNFCKLSIDDFVSGNQIKFDIYIRLSEKKYIKIAHQGENIPIERIHAYKAKNIKYLCMQKEDFRKYINLNLTLLPLVAAKSTISKDKKRHFLKHTSDVIMENLHLNGVDEVGFENAKTVVEATAALLTEPDEMMNLINMLDAHGDQLYAHGLGVSAYSVMIAKEIGWTSASNIYKVAMGGLLHDIGKKEIPKDILEKQRKDMSAEEVKMYESHPQRGAEILGQIPSVPSDILQIVMQHHENCLGLGFPLRLMRRRIHPMAKVVSLANEFCTLVLKGPSSMNLSPTQAIQRLSAIQPDRFESQLIAALKKLFKMDDK
jgi:putative nucleotidyltransferase with HDIG domain